MQRGFFVHSIAIRLTEGKNGSLRETLVADNIVTTLKTVCSHDCPDACSILVDVEGGRAVGFRGDPHHPVTRGFLCGKVGSYEEVTNATDRILHPMRRIGAKGDARFERITWDEAIELVSGKLKEVRGADQAEGESILLYYYGGTMGYVHRFCAEALFRRLGATRLRQNICYYGADAGYTAVVGDGYGVDIEDVEHSDFITVWGANIATTQVHLVPLIDTARRNGASVWVVDPYRNRTVRMGDSWVQVRPGTDTALALGVLHVLERDDLVDREFIERRTVGYDRLRDTVLPRFGPNETASITGVPTATLENFAAQLAAARAPLFKVGIGLGRNSHGAAGVRAICCLAGALGAYAERGGGVLYDSGCEFKLDLAPLKRPDWQQKRTREMNMTDLGIALTEWSDPPIRFLYVHGSNPAATAPLQNRCVAGLEREDLFTVVHERFMTDTARFADVVLPAPMFPEVADLYKSYGHLYLQFARQALSRPGEVRSNLDVIQSLGKRLGFADPWFDHDEAEFVRQILAATDHENFRDIDLDRLLRGETLRLNVPRARSGFAERFGTPSGKLEFYSESLVRAGQPGVVDYFGDPFNEEPDRYPFRLITPPAHDFLNSSFCHSKRSRAKESGEPRCLIHPEDADGRFRDGDMVELTNEHGHVRLRALVTDATLPGVIVAEGTWWPSRSVDRKGINVLTSARLTDLGGGSTFHDNRVALRSLGDS